MKRSVHILLLLLLCEWCALFGQDAGELQSHLMDDLLIVDYWNMRLADRLPVTYNNLLQGGYFAMPSARMGKDGEISLGYSYVHPYRNYNLRCQILESVELTGNYRVFRGIKDPVLSQFGFGDFSDKGANIKFSLFAPEDSDYLLPGVAIGFEDFIGTKTFYANYLVFTQVLLDKNLELSLGVGTGRIRGFFGGINWMPLRQHGYRWLRTLSLSAEYDATPYHKSSREPHPKGREQKCPINFGLKYRLAEYFDFSLSYMRGKHLSFSAAAFYNLGNTNGFLPKIDTPLLYKAPVNFEPLGLRRPESCMTAELAFAFQQQELTLLDIYLFYNPCLQKSLRLKVLNESYRLECELRERLNFLLAALIPLDIEEVIVEIESEGFSIQEYHYRMHYVRQYAEKEICSMELNVLTPLVEVTAVDAYNSSHLFARGRHLYNFELSPNVHTLFGSSNGKFKYTLGLHAAFNGFIWNDVYYNVLVGYTFATNMKSLNSFDRLNPSQLINVRTDIIDYYKNRGITLDEAYLQKNWNLGAGWYTRLATGYFELEYGGLATELLYYPLHSAWAVGIEGALVKKRTHTGVGFTNKIRKLDGFNVTYRKFLGSQYFFNVYYDCEPLHVDFKVSVGKFLANDWGVRNEVSRYFNNGLRLTLWYTVTNGHDKINGKTYYDKGVSFSMPFDIFYTYSERSRWNYGLSAWLRDVGAQAMTGLQLYELINDQRQ